MHAIHNRVMAAVLDATIAGSTMRLAIRLLAATLFVMALGLAPASAGPLPAASYYEAAWAGQYDGFYSSTTLGTVTSSALVGSVTESSTATISASGISVSSSAGANVGCGNYVGAGYACAEVTYYAEIVGPAGDVPVDVTGSGTLNANPGQSSAQITFPRGGGDFWSGCLGAAAPCSGSAHTTFDSGTAFDISTVDIAIANAAFEIDMEAFVTCPNGCTETATITPPTFTIDPDFVDASQYSIIYSSGLPPSWTGESANVPEPGTLGILSAALGSLGLLRRRRRA